jgi:hypothetical protein
MAKWHWFCYLEASWSWEMQRLFCYGENSPNSLLIHLNSLHIQLMDYLHLTKNCRTKDLSKPWPFWFHATCIFKPLRNNHQNNESLLVDVFSIIQLKPGNIYRVCMVFKGLRPKMSEENQLKYVVQQDMLLRVLELGYDNEFQTQIFSLIVTQILAEPRVCFQCVASSWLCFITRG